ncbi:MAG: LuxR family transcriptional regulator, partial [Sphingobacteriaceae bacterium]
MHQLPAGLLNGNIEFFMDQERVHLYKLKEGRVVPFESWSENIKSIIWRHITADPKRFRALIFLARADRDRMIRQFMICLYGGFDNQADMVGGRLQQQEYWACPKRGSCPHEGIICAKLQTDTGAYLSNQEIKVLKLIAAGYLDKEIAAELNISVNTVPMHTK